MSPFLREAVEKGRAAESALQHANVGSNPRRVRARLEGFVAVQPATEPMPCAQCDICDFLPLCTEWWEQVDHLSRVAGCGRTQIERLAPTGITTLRALARANLKT